MSRAWIQTLNRGSFDYGALLDGIPQRIDLNEIGWVLAGKWRYSGHTKPRISVAEHSIRVGNRVFEITGDREAARCGFAHDFGETYTGDVNRPLKWLFADEGITIFREIEDRLEALIAAAFDLKWTDEIHRIVKQADHEACAYEKRYILGTGPRDPEWAWLPDLPPNLDSLCVLGWSADTGLQQFRHMCQKWGFQ